MNPMTTDEKLENAWLAVTMYGDGSDEQISLCHDLVCHDGEACLRDAGKCVDLPVDRDMLAMLDLARYVRDDEGDTDEQSFRLRWHGARAS